MTGFAKLVVKRLSLKSIKGFSEIAAKSIRGYMLLIAREFMTNKSSYLEHAAVTVCDIEWSIRFFEDVLGMEVTRRKEINGKLEQVWLRGGIQLIASPDNPAAGRGHHLGIVVEDFNSVLKEMLAYEGVHAIDGKPEKWVELPDGLVLELFQEKPGAIDKILSIDVK